MLELASYTLLSPERRTRVRTRELTSHSSTPQIKLCGVPPKREEKCSDKATTQKIIVNHSFPIAYILFILAVIHSLHHAS